MSTTHTGQREGRESSINASTAEEGEETSMGVASTCSTKRRLEERGDCIEETGDESSLAKIPKRVTTITNNNNNPVQLEDSVSLEASSSDFLTTSILARTLLTTTANSTSINGTPNNAVTVSRNANSSTNTLSLSFPISSCTSDSSLLESSATAKLESMLQQLQPETPFSILPPLLDDEIRSSANGILTPGSTTRTVTILSPIDAADDDDDEWTLLNSVTRFKTSSAADHMMVTRSGSSISPLKNALMAVSDVDSQVITEDENGKSYFNLGASEAMIVARKNSSSSSVSTASSSSSQSDSSGKCWNSNSNNSNNNNGKADSSNNNNNNNDDASSTSSSCDSISSEDLFNSCEDFDPSDDDDDDDEDEDEEDERNYKQMRSNILHLSLCKLNMFRTQQCVEPSLHRSVLICNTLRHIESEIRTEDEIRQDEAFLKSRDKLPSFWPKTNHLHHQQQQQHHQHQLNNRLGAQQKIIGKPIAPPRGPSSPLHSPAPPYLSSPNPYATSNGSIESPPLFSSYDYNLLCTSSQTPFHSISYDEYSSPLIEHASPHQQHLPCTNVGPGSLSTNNSTTAPTTTILPDLISPLSPPSSNLTLFECDSGYDGGEDLDLSSYYFGTSITSASSSPFEFPNCTSIVTSNSCNGSSSSSENVTTSTCYANNNYAIASNTSSMGRNNCSTNNNSQITDNSKCNGISNPHCSNPQSSSTKLTPVPPSDISDIICSSSSNIIPSRNSSSTSLPSVGPPRNLLTNCHPSSASVEIELCSNRIISNEYNLEQNNNSHGNNSKNSNGKLEANFVATTTTIWSSSNLSSTKHMSPVSPPPASSNSSTCPMVNLQSFAQQESQCGIESRLTDFNTNPHAMMMNGHIGHSPHHQHLLPMDSLISSTYSADS